MSRRSLGRAAVIAVLFTATAAALNLVTQGITTVVVGLDGGVITMAQAVRDGQPTGALDGRVLEGDEFVRRRPASPVVGSIAGSIAGSTAPVGPPPTAAAR